MNSELQKLSDSLDARSKALDFIRVVFGSRLDKSNVVSDDDHTSIYISSETYEDFIWLADQLPEQGDLLVSEIKLETEIEIHIGDPEDQEDVYLTMKIIVAIPGFKVHVHSPFFTVPLLLRSFSSDIISGNPGLRGWMEKFVMENPEL